MNMKQRVFHHFTEQKGKRFTKTDIRQALGVSPVQRKWLHDTLKEMEREKLLHLTKKKQYQLQNNKQLLMGRFYGNSKGYGFVVNRVEKTACFISPNDIGEAMHEDWVVAECLTVPKEGNPTGRIISVLKRTTEKVVGTYFEHEEGFGFVIPDNANSVGDFYVPVGQSCNAKHYDKVSCAITKYPTKRRRAEVQVQEIIGLSNDTSVELKSILIDRGLPYEFPQKAMKEAESKLVDMEFEVARRLDLREQLIFTIDGSDAKDLDDAVSVEPREGNILRLGVHIADVAHYVKEDGALDKEAFARGTSAYFIDTVIPMLPASLSNDRCSLHPGTDKLTLSVFIDIDPNGAAAFVSAHETIISSKARLTYDEVSAYLEGELESLEHHATGLDQAASGLLDVANRLRLKRLKRGAIAFNLASSTFQLRTDGTVESIALANRGSGHILIEECMLACNEAVAKWMHGKQLPFVYRTHSSPKMDRFKTFIDFVSTKGYVLELEDDFSPKELQLFLNEINGKKEEKGIQLLLLRMMTQAKYQANCTGHFGLAATHYTHFTSPIRRYPDLMIHRMLKAQITGKSHAGLQNEWEKKAVEVAMHCSRRERIAEQAEKDFIHLKQLEWARERKGEVYFGVISHINNTGMEITLENGVCGSLTLDKLPFEAQFNPETQNLETADIPLAFGDKLTVQLSTVSEKNREIVFAYISRS